MKVKSCSCRTLFDVENKKHKIIQLEILSAEEGFWDAQEKARNIMQELEHLREDVDKFESVQKDAKDLLELSEIAETDEEWEQIAQQVNKVQKTVEKIEFYTMFDEEYDTADAIISIHTGAGGVDAQDWSDMILAMYVKWAEKKGYKVTVLDKVDGAEAGIKSATVEIKGKWAYGHLRAEHGVHRLVRLSPFNSDNLRQTSFARVDVMPVVGKIGEVELNMDDVRIDTYRSSGAGGQSVNTTDSAVRVTHEPTGLQAQCQNERSQLQNKENALKFLKAKLHKKYLDEQEEKKKKLRGEMVEAGWGNQIRSYVLHPYKMVKDHRTKHESPQVDDVLDGDIDAFIIAFLQQ